MRFDLLRRKDRRETVLCKSAVTILFISAVVSNNITYDIYIHNSFQPSRLIKLDITK